MKKYRITVNGKTFDVDVEEVGRPASTTAAPPPAASAQSTPAQSPVAPPRPASPAPTAPSPKPAASPAGTGVMKSPLPGKVLKVMATPGSSWKKGDTLLIIEAMKMENEILAPADGTIDQVFVQKGSTVETGAALCSLK